MAGELTPEQKRKRRRRRLLLLALLLLPAVLVVGAFLFLGSSAGSAFLRAQILDAANGALEGKLDLDRVTLEGNHLVATNLRLYTPEGQLVASIERLEADVDLRALTAERLNLSNVKVIEPKLLLREEENGWNLTRAIAQRKAEKETVEKATKNGWIVDVSGLSLTDGRFELHQASRDLVVQNFTLDGKAKVELAKLKILATLQGGGKFVAPLEDDLKIEAASEDGEHANARITLGESLVALSYDNAAEQLQLTQLTLAPREMNAFAPGWPVKPAVLGRGLLSRTTASLELSAGAARVVASARYALDAHQVSALELKADQVDLQELVGAELPSTFTAHLNGKLDDWRADTLSGVLTGDASWLAKGEKLFDAKLDAVATTGALEVKKLDLIGSGLELVVRGTAAPGKLNLFGKLEAKDLKQLDKSLVTFAGIQTGGLEGTGKVQLMVKGPLTHPAVSAMGKLEHLRIADVRTEQLSLSFDLPDAAKPFDTDVLLTSQKLRYGERVFDEVALDFLTRGRDIDLDFTTKGMGDLQAHVIAKLQPGNTGAAVSAVDLKWTGATWSLESPTTLRWGEVFELEPMVLHDEERRLSVRVKKTRKTLDAELHAQSLDLAKLPSALAPPSWELGGTVTTLDVAVAGSPDVPIVAVKTKVVDGRVWAISGLQLVGDANWNDGRLSGTLGVESDVGHLDGNFDVPLIGLRDEKPEPARAHFTLREVKTAFVEQKLEQKLPFTGALSGTLDLDGTGEHPNVTAKLTAPRLEAPLPATAPAEDGQARQSKRFSKPAAPPPLVLTDVVLEVRTRAEDDTLSATFDANALGGTHHLAASAPLTLSSLRRRERSKDDWLSLPITVDFDFAHVSLVETLALRGETDDELKGAVSVSGQLKGSARAPLGKVTVSVEKLTLPPVREADLKVDVVAEAERTRFTGDGALKGIKAVDFTATVAAAPQKVLSVLLAPEGNADAVIDALKDTRLDALVTMAPFDLTEVLRRDESAVLPGGTANAQLEASGTLEAPTARLTGTIANLRFDKMTLGSARADVRIGPKEQLLTLALGGTGRDDFKAKGSTGLDLRLSALKKGLQWKTAPVELSLNSRNFDLGFLSGASETLRTVGGRLDLTGDVNGELGAPKFTGDAKLTQGRLALAGLGDYRDIELQVHATNDLVDVTKLQLASGAGNASLVAKAERQPNGTFRLSSSGKSERLPLVNDDQLLASLTMEYAMDGEYHDSDVDLRTVSIPHAEVQLPEVKRKDLQDLQRPKDIIVLRRGARATQRQRADVREASNAPPEPTTRFAAVFDAPRNLWVRSSDVNIELGLSDGFRLDRDEAGLRLSGEARVLQGTLSVIGREFTAQKGSTARFAGPPTQPYVNVTALHVNTKEDVKITVTVAGKGTDVNIKATSEPPLPESDIYAILATGRRTLKNSGGASITPGQAASVVGQLAASQLKTVIAKKVPIDVFNFETSDNFDKVKLDVGKYIGDSVYVGATVNIGARRERGENTWAGRLELQMTRSVTLEAYAGDALSFGADAVWSQDF
ncbi:MAG: translocation/assembly module TamB domain-containing protein [Archangium sp.]